MNKIIQPHIDYQSQTYSWSQHALDSSVSDIDNFLVNSSNTEMIALPVKAVSEETGIIMNMLFLKEKRQFV